MKLPLFIAFRYLFSPKRHRAANLIMALSACGVSLATLAMVCTLSVFNGFQSLASSLFTAFDPQLKITPAAGSVFTPADSVLPLLRSLPQVEEAAETLELPALVRYKSRQRVIQLKGVEDSFRRLTSIDSLLIGNGRFLLSDSSACYGVMGAGLMSALGTGIRFVTPLRVYVPRPGTSPNPALPRSAFRSGLLHSPGVVFATGREPQDSRLLLAPLSFVRRLYGYTRESTAVELRLREGSDEASVQRALRRQLGPSFRVENRHEQQADVFRIMQAEKLLSYLFLTLILAVSSFGLAGSLSMLIAEKRADLQTLRSLGASSRLYSRVPFLAGAMASLAGSLAGIGIGLLLCWLQQRFGLLRLGQDASLFVTDAYPVSVHASDLLLVFLTVQAVTLPILRISCTRIHGRPTGSGNG